MEQQLEHFPFPVCTDMEKGVQNTEMDEIQAMISRETLLEKVKAGDGGKIFARGRVYQIFRDRQNEKAFYLLPCGDDGIKSAGFLAGVMNKNAGMLLVTDALEREELSPNARTYLARLRHDLEREIRLTENAGLAQGKAVGGVRSINIGSFLNEALGRVLYYLPDRKATLHSEGEIRFVCNPQKLEILLYIFLAECFALTDPDTRVHISVQTEFRNLMISVTVEGSFDGKLLEKRIFESEIGNPAFDAFRRLIGDCKGSFFVRQEKGHFTLVMRFAEMQGDAGLMNVEIGLGGYDYAKLQLAELLPDEVFSSGYNGE